MGMGALTGSGLGIYYHHFWVVLLPFVFSSVYRRRTRRYKNSRRPSQTQHSPQLHMDRNPFFCYLVYYCSNLLLLNSNWVPRAGIVNM